MEDAVYAHRITGCDRDNRDPRLDAAAGASAGPGERAGGGVHEPTETARHGPVYVCGRMGRGSATVGHPPPTFSTCSLPSKSFTKC